MPNSVRLLGGSTLIDIGQAGHNNADSGHGEWSEGYKLLQQFMA